MRFMKIACLAAALACAASAWGADVKVIVNAGVGASDIGMEDLKRVFLQTKSSLPDGTPVQPVLLKGGATHEAFLRDILGKTDAALQTYYRSLVFTGKGSMPKTLGSDAEVAAFVAANKGAIGYVSPGAVSGGVKALDVK